MMFLFIFDFIYSRYKERLQTKHLKDSRNKLKLTAGLNSHNWIFMPKGLDDFRDGYPMCSETTFTSSRKGVFPGLQNATYEKDPAEENPRKKLTKEQTCFSKVLPRQQARREYISQIEYGLTQHPLALYPHLEEAVPPELFEEMVDVLDPEMRLKSASGSYKAEEEEDIEDDDKFSTPHKEPQDVLSVKSMEASSRLSTLSGHSRQKNPYTWLSKKEESLKEEKKLKTNHNLAPALDESVKLATKEFCEWVTSLGGESGSVNESSIYSLFATDYDTRPALSVPIHVVELNNVPAELRKSVGMTARQSNLKNSRSKLLHQSEEITYHPRYVKSRYGAWYLDPKTWKKIKINEPLKDPNIEKLVKSTDSKNKISQKDEELLQLHGTMAFKEFTEKEGYRKPEVESLPRGQSIVVVASSLPNCFLKNILTHQKTWLERNQE
uniref:Protein FAM47E n=1 Tax=Leptobrachium leishanense TaxID=445787 RepID=A0A8C5LSI5_9ANUR